MSQKLLRVCPTTSSCWALGCFFHLSGPAHCPLVWIMLLFVYGGLVFFSFIYILSLFRRIQTIWRQQGWRSCSKLCRVCAAFLDSTSFFKYNPCHFFNIIPCQPWVSVPSLVSCWAVLFGRSQAESALTFHAEEPQHWAQWWQLEFLKVPSLLCSMCLLRPSFLFHFLILGKCHLYTSFQEQVQCHAEKKREFWKAEICFGICLFQRLSFKRQIPLEC